MEAPPVELAKKEGLQSAFLDLAMLQKWLSSGYSSFNRRLDTPFKLFTNAETECLGGYETNK